MEQQVQDWLAAYRAGQVEALGALVEHYRRPLFGFIARMLESHADAEEVFQEVWLRAIKNLHRFDDAKVLSWLFRIAHNLVIDRSRRARPALSLDLPATEEAPALAERLAAPGLDPAQKVAGRDLGGRIAAAVARLPVEQRAVFLLRMESDVSFKKIAKLQGVSINTALGRMHYALMKLREELREDFQLLGRTES